MFRNNGQFPATYGGDQIAVARRRRTEYIASRIDLSGGWRNLFIALAAATGVAVLTKAYAMLLAATGIPTPAPILFGVLLAATLASIAGFVFSAICAVMLLQIMSGPVEVVEIMLVCGVAIELVGIALLWRDIDWRNLTGYMAGGVIGLPIGAWVLLTLGGPWFEAALVTLLFAYVAFRLLNGTRVIEADGALADMSVGLLGGIAAGLAGFPGVPVMIGSGLRGIRKRRQRGIHHPFVLLMQIMALAVILVMRSDWHASEIGFDPLQFVPPALLGASFGVVILRRFPEPRLGLR